MIEIGTIEPVNQDDGKSTPTFRMLGKRPRPSTEVDISEQHWLSEFYAALLDVEHGRAEMEIREKKLESLLEGRAVGLRRRKSFVPLVVRTEET